MGLAPQKYLIGIVVALLVGFSKTGIPNIGMLYVPLMAEMFPARQSVGALLPLLIVGDVFAVYYYKRHAQWKHLRPLLPFVYMGMVPALILLRHIKDAQLRPVLGAIVGGLLVVELARRKFQWTNAPHTWWFAAIMGVLAGFATTVGNVAGSVMTVYLISRGLPKENFMGTSAWYYMIVNVSKFPFFYSLGMINAETLHVNLILAPFAIAGALAGVRILPYIPQKTFNALMLALAAIAAARMILF